MSNENIPLEELIEAPASLSQRRKFFCAIIFLIGMPLSYPTVFPFGLLCTSFLLFQKSKTIVRAGIFLVLIQLLALALFGFVYAIPPFQPYGS